MRWREVSRFSAQDVDTIEVAKIRVLWSVVPGVTVNTGECVLGGTTRAADNNESDNDENASFVIAAAAAETFGSAIVLETSVEAEVVIVAYVGVIVTLNAGWAKRFEAGCAVFERVESDDAWVTVRETNKKGAPLENRAPTTTKAEPKVAECGKGIKISGRKPAL